jgi:hypothetical protein
MVRFNVRHFLATGQPAPVPGCPSIARQAQSFADDFSDGHSRIQARVRILKNHLHLTGIAVKSVLLYFCGSLSPLNENFACRFVV